MENKILAIIHEINPYEEVTVETQLLESGVIDSMAMLFLIEELERAYSFKLPEAEFKAENFVSVTAIKNMVQRVLQEEIK